MDKKPSLLMILGKEHKDPEEKSEEEGSDDDVHSQQLSVMEHLIAAIKEGDAEAALEEYQELCQLHQDSKEYK